MRELKVQDPEWVIRARKNLTDLYEGNPLEQMPFEFIAYTDVRSNLEEKSATISASTRTVEDYKREIYDYELALENQLKAYENRIDTEFYDDSIITIGPLGGAQGWFVEFFGGINEWFPNRPPFPHPLIDSASQIDSLKPDISKGDLFRVALEQMRYFAKEVGDKIPVTAPDMQSPVDFCSMLMDYTNLIYLMIDEPKKIHQLMEMITETLIKAMKLIKAEMVTDWPITQFSWWQPGEGVFMSDDLMAVLDAPLYEEFGKPYNEIITEEFGRVSLHSCGNIKHNLENVANTKGIVALNTHETLETFAEVIQDRAVAIIGGVKEVIAPNYPGIRRDKLQTGQEVADLWWEDFNHLPEITGQRCLYQCQALLKGDQHTPQETYDKMLEFSRKMVNAGS